MKFSASESKEAVFKKVESIIAEDYGFNIVSKDSQRPWGGFLVIDEAQSLKFIETFFSHLSTEDFKGFSKLSPKILLVAPEKRLSWQYHHRRAEIWKVIGGKAGVIVSETNQETPVAELKQGDVIDLEREHRHRLVGLDEWGVIAEIWKHTDPDNPSDEDDIVRVQDDFGR